MNTDSLGDFIAHARWFGGKGRDFEVTDVRRLAEVPGSEHGVPSVVYLVDVTYAEGDTERYQLPLVFHAEPQRRLDHAFVGWWEEPGIGWSHVYDALHDAQAMAGWLRGFGGQPATGLTFHRTAGHDLELDAPAAAFSGEQSNTSVFFGETAIMKVFRKITPGENPDISTHAVLTEAGSTHVAALYGWIESSDPVSGELLHLGMLQQFLRTASDGWEQALVSVRNLFAEADLHADEVGGDFAGEAARLGDALAEVHEQLRESFGTQTYPASEIASAMNTRLDAAIQVVAPLADHAAGLRRAYAALGALGDLPVQRIHADLHLGQTLRTVVGWKLVDFEGEPAKPLAERLLPDSPWRDVAGMLRSFDYAPHAVVRAAPERDPDVAAQRGHRAEEWAARNKSHFLATYAGGHLSTEQGTLVAAYVADKAVYECVYEARNRPSWLAIPLTAVARIGAP